MSGATAAGLLQCSVGWHSIALCTALTIGDERGRTSRLRVIKVRSHHAVPTPVTLTESFMADRLQADCSGLQMSSWRGTSYLADELHHPAESEFRRRLRSSSSHKLSIPRTRLSTYGDRAFPVQSPLEQSSAACHICSVTSRLLFLLEYIYVSELCYP